ncbi:MAG: SPFH/Band 7/PHB domain protein [Paludibacteraceae bacterium]|nr:SPFH/Band 7/PHB domain protein [Paludibacteraceae bacterium]
MTAGTIILIIVGIVVIAYVLKGIKIVSQSETMIIERLGRYHRTLNAGINVILPIVERAKETATRMSNGAVRLSNKIDLREQVFDFDKQSVITKDNVMTEINALLYFQIVDPVKSVYEIKNLPMAIEKLTQTTLRNVVGELELDETLTSRDTINSKLRAVLDDATNKWGVKVNRVELQDITPPQSIRIAMEKQMQAERDRRAEILKAEGEKQSAILKSEGEKSAEINAAEAEKQARVLKAEGQAKAQILQAEAEAQAIKNVADSVASIKGADPVNYLLAIKYIDGLKEMTKGKDNKTVYIPYEATGVLGSLGSLKEMFGGK